jgi:protein subunit release factor B
VADRLLHAWLISDEGEGAAFLADVWRMLTRVAERDGCALQSTATPGARASGTSQLAGMTGTPSKLSRETGVHRAQRVPADSTTGRVATSLVGVEVLPLDSTPSTGRPSGDVLKTYNYVKGAVIRHASGDRGSLTQGLEGDV